MADIANIGFAADTSALKDAKSSLEALVPSAAKADSSSQKLATSLSKVDASAAKLLAAATGLSSAVDKMSAVLDRSSGAAKTAAVAQGNLATAATDAAGAVAMTGNAAVSTSRQLEQLDAHVSAYRANLRQMKIDTMAAGTGTQQLDAHVFAYRKHLDDLADGAKRAGSAIKFTAQDGLNASRQLADIGVTAALGMSPFLIAIQQGPQLLDILQNRAAQSGQTIGAVFKAAGMSIWAALAPLLPLILGIAAVIGVVAAAFGLATREINKGVGDVATGLGLTEKQLKKLEKAGIDTSVTMGDTFKAFFQVLGENIASLLAGPIKSFSAGWAATMDLIVQYGTIAIKGIIGAFVGGFYAIKATWSLLPSAIGDLAISAANLTIGAVDFLVNKSIDGLNKLIGFANSAAAKVGLSGLGTISNVSFDKVKNPYVGAAADAGTAIAEGFVKGKAASDAAVDRFFSDVAKRARANRAKIIKEAAGEAEKTAKGPKTDAAKFDDIVKGAEADIAVQKARASAVALSAEAAATLEQKTKLLNEAQSKGIALTDAMRLKIDELSAAYGKAKVAADNAIALRDILKGADGTLASLKSQAELIGLVGRNLAFQTEMQKLLNEAKAKGLTIDAATRAQFEDKANKIADQSQANAKGTFMADAAKQSQEAIIRAQQEASYIGLTADQVTRLRIENELLNAARQKGIDLTPADIAAIQGIAQAQADQENSLRKLREAYQFGKDTFKGFFNDLRSGLSQGKSLWESFGQAVVNALNKIVDKLLDNVLNSAFDALFGALTGGGGNFLSGLFGFAAGGSFGGGRGGPTDQTFGSGRGKDGSISFNAKGNAFTNGLFNKPTMFAYGGSNLGIMGEAGPEAVMPLKRGSDGSLGVQMHGAGSSGGTMINAPVTINNDNRVSGAVSSADIVAMQRASAEQTKAQIARDIPNIIRQYQRDGALV